MRRYTLIFWASIVLVTINFLYAVMILPVLGWGGLPGVFRGLLCIAAPFVGSYLLWKADRAKDAGRLDQATRLAAIPLLAFPVLVFVVIVFR